MSLIVNSLENNQDQDIGEILEHILANQSPSQVVDILEEFFGLSSDAHLHFHKMKQEFIHFSLGVLESSCFVDQQKDLFQRIKILMEIENYQTCRNVDHDAHTTHRM